MPLVTPFSQSVCPYCFSRFHLGDCEIVSSTTGEVLRYPTDGKLRFISRVWVPATSGAENTRSLAARRCPKCEELLPPNIEYMDGKIIGLVGGGGSGKSHYIASLIGTLERQDALAGVGCWRFSAADQDVQMRYEEEYYGPLFRRHEVIPPTNALPTTETNRPLIYEIVFERKAGAQRGRKGVHLVFFDGAGEQIADQRSAVLVNRYIQYAAALILLVDPMSIPSVAANLPPELRPAEPAPAHEAINILNTVARIYRREWGLRPSDPIRVPLAITVAKSDLFRYLPPYSSGRWPRFLHDPGYQDGFSLAQFQATSQEVRDLLRSVSERGFFQAVRAFTDVSYHAVSATGEPPDPATNRFAAVKPIRCLDPLVWILWRLGLIQARRS